MPGTIGGAVPGAAPERVRAGTSGAGTDPRTCSAALGGRGGCGRGPGRAGRGVRRRLPWQRRWARARRSRTRTAWCGSAPVRTAAATSRRGASMSPRPFAVAQCTRDGRRPRRRRIPLAPVAGAGPPAWTRWTRAFPDRRDQAPAHGRSLCHRGTVRRRGRLGDTADRRRRGLDRRWRPDGGPAAVCEEWSSQTSTTGAPSERCTRSISAGQSLQVNPAPEAVQTRRTPAPSGAAHPLHNTAPRASPHEAPSQGSAGELWWCA